MYGWYSEKQKNITGNIFVYLDKDGEKVYVTSVTKGSTHSANFDDIVYCGKIYNFVDCISP